jgi:hypothetical protein
MEAPLTLRRTPAALAALLLAAAPLPGQAPALTVGLDLLPNLTYQLDCVSDVGIACSADNFRALWTRDFLRTARDSALLAQWRTARDRYSQELAPPRGPGAVAFPLSGRFESLDVRERIRLAGLQATSTGDYASRLELVTLPGDRERLLETVRHFLPAFEAWWRREALPGGAPFAARTQALLREPRVSRRLGQFARFYGAELSASDTLRFVLFFRPALVEEGTNGQQIGRYSLVEFVPGERPEERLDVVVHELAHYLYSRTPDTALAALEGRFVALAAAGSGSAVAAYNLLDEGLATAFGNGIVARELLGPERFGRILARPNSLYNNPWIDGAAKATLPWMDAWLESGATISDPRFAARYVAALDSAMGRDLLRPRLHLNRLVVVGDEGYGVRVSRLVRAAFRPSSMYAREDACCTEATLAEFRGNPGLNALFIIPPAKLDALARLRVLSAAQAAEIRGRAARDGGAIYATRRGPTSTVYVVAAPEASGIEPLLQRLANLPATFDGFAPAATAAP